MNRYGSYTNWSVLLSDQCVHTIKAAVFEGTTQNEFKDRREFAGSLFEQMNEAYDYIDFRNQNHSTFLKLHRIDRRDYPEAAARESLLNLLAHGYWWKCWYDIAGCNDGNFSMQECEVGKCILPTGAN